MNKVKFPFLALLFFLAADYGLRAQGTAFTYQGNLNVGGAPANGNYDLSFTLYDAATNGDEIGSVTNLDIGITGGSFISVLEFGGVFSGTNYWLQIAARTNGGGAFTTLSPRQPVLPVPYAVYAANAGNAATASNAMIAASANSVAGSNIVGSVAFAQLPPTILTNNATGVVLNGTFTGNAGGLTNLAATNLTGIVPIANLPDPEAAAFCINNGITDPAVQSDVMGFVRELRSSGTFNQLADGLLLHPRFNPTNNLSFFGHSETVVNPAFSSWGALFNGSNSIQLPLASPVTSNTLVFVFRSPYTSTGGNEFMLGLENSNTFSADWMWQYGNAGTYEVWERDTQYIYPYGGNTFQPYCVNLVQPRWIGSTATAYLYSFTEGANRMNQRKVFTMSNDGQGNSQVWQDTVQAQIGYNVLTFIHSSPVVNPDQMNVLCVGQDYPNVAGNSGPWTGEMSVVLVFKGVLTQAQVNSAYRAVRWLEPDTVERFYFGDSLTAPDFPGVNNYPQDFQNGKPGQNCWHNYAQGGTTALQFGSYPLTAISCLPYPSKVKEIDVCYAFGINDIYQYGSAAPLLGYMTNAINAIAALGANVSYMAISHLYTGAVIPYVYTPYLDAIGVAVNQYFYSNYSSGNIGVAAVIPRDQISSDALLNPANGFSTDGLHYYGSLGYVANQAIADYMLGKPYIVGYSIPNPAHPVWPYDIYGNVWLDATTNLPASQIAGPIPSAALAGSYTSAVSLTNPSNSISGNGAGLTNVPAAGLAGGLTTNIMINGQTFYYSNGVLINVQ